MHNCKTKNQLYINTGALGTAGVTASFLNSASGQAPPTDISNFRQIGPSRWQFQSDGSLLVDEGDGIQRIVPATLFMMDDGLLYVHESALGSEVQVVGLLRFGSVESLIGAGALLGLVAWVVIENRPETRPSSVALSGGNVAEGVRGADTRTIDLSTHFKIASARTYSILDGGTPDGFSLDASTGILVQDVGSIEGVGDHVIKVQGEDIDGQISVVTVNLVVPIQHYFGDRYLSGTVESISGSTAADALVFGDNPITNKAKLSIGTGSANDTLIFGTFGRANALDLSGDLIIDTGDGNDFASFGENAGSGSITVNIDTGDGNDRVEFDDGAGDTSGNLTIDTGEGGDSVEFGLGAGGSRGNVTIDTGEGGDELVFGQLAGIGGGNVAIDVGPGDDSVKFGDRAGAFTGNLDIVAGQGDDIVEFGNQAGFFNGNVTIDAGQGDDIIVFGDEAAAGFRLGTVDVKTGEGNDTVTVGKDASLGLTVDLGDDDSVDSVVFSPLGAGGVETVSIRNWTMGIDSKVDVADTDTWTGATNGDNVVFTGNGSIVFEGIASTVASLDVADFLM